MKIFYHCVINLPFFVYTKTVRIYITHFVIVVKMNFIHMINVINKNIVWKRSIDWDKRHFFLYVDQSLKKKKLYGPFLWMWFNCLKATEPLRGGSFLFTTKFPGIPGTHLIDIRRMKG